MAEHEHAQTAAEAGWHPSRYIVSAQDPETGQTIAVNLLKGSCYALSWLEELLVQSLDSIDAHHPGLPLLERHGLICNYDELALIEAQGRMECAAPGFIGLVICPTMGCNFDCPYCFEDHFAGKMTQQVQDDVISLVKRMIAAFKPKTIDVTWFGGEPLLALDVIESLTPRLVELAEQSHAAYSAGIITNGWFLTQDVADRLERCKINLAQITIDGIGPVHDATRRLAGGGGTFDRIVGNLRATKFPFPVSVRHNIYEGNRGSVPALEQLVAQLSEESGNEISIFTSRVVDNEAAEGRQSQVELLCGTSASEEALQIDIPRFGHGRSHFCGASQMSTLGIDHLGNLYRCWESVDKPKYSFGSAHDWDPLDPLHTATHPDMLSAYLTIAGGSNDPECRACVWLPYCAGGCPQKRLFEPGTICMPYRDDPEAFVLSLYAGSAL